MLIFAISPLKQANSWLETHRLSTDVKLLDVFLDFVGERLAERHALVWIVLFTGQAKLHHLLDDRRRLLDRKQHLRLHAVRVFILDLLDASSVRVDHRVRQA